MWPRWLVPRFSIRTLLLAVSAIAVGLWSYLYLPDILHNRQDRLSRAAIDPYELSIAGNGDPAKSPPELVAILGDSRLKHWASVWDVAFVDKTTLFSRGRDETIRFWDTKTGRQLRELPTAVCCISGDGSKLFFVSPSKGDAIEVWDAVNWKRESVVDLKEGKRCLGLLASRDGSRFVAALGDSQSACDFQVWDVSKSGVVRRFPKVHWTRGSCGLDDSGKRLALYDGDIVHVWDVDTGLELGKAGPFIYETTKATLIHCLFLPAANEVVTADAGGAVVIWNYETGAELSRLPKSSGSTSMLMLDSTRNALFNGDGRNVYLYERGGEDWFLREEVTSDSARRGVVSCMAYRGGSMAFACSDHCIVLNPPVPSSASWPDVTHLAFDPLGRFLATANRGGEISLWQMKSWKQLRTWPAQARKLSQLLFAPDGSSLVSLGNDEAIVWDPLTGAEQLKISTGGAHPRQMAISPDSRLLASLAHVRGGACPFAVRLWNLADGTLYQTITHPSASSSGQLAFAGSSDTLVMGGGQGITVWDLPNSKLLANLGSMPIHVLPLAVHQDGYRAIMQPSKSAIEVWDILAQKLLLGTTPHGDKSLATSIAIHPEGKWAASAADDGTACLWEIDTGAIVKQWQLGPPQGKVFQVAFSPDGRYLATVNGNGTAYILRLDWIAGVKP